MRNDKLDKYTRAKKRVEELKGFYIHAVVYTIVNAFILVNIYLHSSGNFWKIEHFSTLFFWGIGLFFHASKVFGFNPLFNKKWEQRQIEKYIAQDKEDKTKFTK